MRRFAGVAVMLALVLPAFAQDVAPPAPAVPLTGEAINAADILHHFAVSDRAYIAPPEETEASAAEGESSAPPKVPDAALVRVQVLLDQAGASPGVIDGYDGDNLRKAIMAYQEMAGLPVTGNFDPDFLARLETRQPVIAAYVITPEDVAAITAPTPEDYAEKAQMEFLGYSSVPELLAERFHMDVDLLEALNPGLGFAAGDSVAAANVGPDRVGKVARIEADKTMRQVRAFDAQGTLLAAYPATIGSEENPSPSGSYQVEVVAPMPDYTYNPEVNFQQGDNTEVLTIPPGPNGPVGSMWIALSKPTYGIHGTPEPALIDKTGSHGCVRLTNWDAGELAGMVEPGVQVDFL
jgi:lipoprotein-anchoring transpeptidase ErfK/SrfK